MKKIFKLWKDFQYFHQMSDVRPDWVSRKFIHNIIKEMLKEALTLHQPWQQKWLIFSNTSSCLRCPQNLWLRKMFCLFFKSNIRLV